MVCRADDDGTSAACQLPAEWQNPHPAMTVRGDIAYVTEPATRSVHAVDLRTGEDVASGRIPGEPIEIAVALG